MRAVAAVGLLAALGWEGSASAHSGTRAWLEARREGREVHVRVELRRADLATAIEVSEADAARRAYGAISARMHVAAGGARCAERDGGVQGGDLFEEPSVAQTVAYACARAGRMELRYDLLFDHDPMHSALLRTYGPEGRTRTALLTRDRRRYAIDVEPTAFESAREMAWSGVEHIVTGYDHVAFVLAVLLMAGLAVRDDAKGDVASVPPSVAARRAVTYAAKVITGFTVGHSVTLVAAALDLTRPDPALVEPAIAASIVYVGVENVLARRARPRVALTTGFGLVHGFGFAGVLAADGLPRQGRLLALLAFNAGIEVGQLAIVLVLLLPLVLAARRGDFRTRVLVPVSVVISVLGAAWFVERVAGFRVLPI